MGNTQLIKKYLNKVLQVMNRAARIITVTVKLEYDVRGVKLLGHLGLMNLTERRDYFMSVLIFHRVNSIVPPSY